jgi:hypothetical protein
MARWYTRPTGEWEPTTTVRLEYAAGRAPADRRALVERDLEGPAFNGGNVPRAVGAGAGEMPA